MSGLALSALTGVKESEVKKLLDQPAQKFLKIETITAVIRRAYNMIFYQINIDTVNQTVVVDAIHAIAAWHCFGAYGNSISQALQLQDIGAFRANLEHYKELAQSAAALINVSIMTEAEQTLNDPLPILETGGSFIDIDRTDL